MSKLYIENSVGRSVTDAFNKFRREHHWEAVFQHDMHPQMQQRQTEGDGWWIREVAANGFAIVSCDLAIVENDDEREAVIDSNAQIVAFARPPSNTSISNNGATPGKNGDGGKVLEISVASNPKAPRGAIQFLSVKSANPTVVGLRHGKPEAIDFIR